MRNHYCFLFLRVLRCFTSPGVALEPYCIQASVSRHYARRVSPFGHHRINACLPLPGAYRSLPRPSSPTDAKAFIVRPYALDQIKPFSLSRRPPVSGCPGNEAGFESCFPFLYAIVKEQGNRLRLRIRGPTSLARPETRTHKRKPKNNSHIPLVACPAPRFLVRLAWWACVESNHGPCPYQGHALTN